MLGYLTERPKRAVAETLERAVARPARETAARLHLRTWGHLRTSAADMGDMGPPEDIGPPEESSARLQQDFT